MIFKAIMRYFSYLFHTLLAVFMIALSTLDLSTGSGNLHLGMLPWTDDTLNYVMLFGALFGLLTVALAIKGTLRILFLIWSFLVFVVLVKGYIFSHYTFQPHEFKTAAWLMALSLIALIGAWFQLSAGPGPKKY